MSIKRSFAKLGFVAASATLAMTAWTAPAQAHPWAEWIGYGQPNTREGVGCFQDLFNDLWWKTGYHPIAEDRLFGPDTDGAIRAFQHWKGLEADGIVGPQTGTALLNETNWGNGNGCDYYIPSY
ncbi:peptidoglycan-binding domain-containing protein [Streptomyces vietnamensis]|uniref:peptidoglycan-binding domain-containing protein n=1 Tax=Streptomyces vietnamensis TaxID=362257 RepID=UPI003416C977